MHSETTRRHFLGRALVLTSALMAGGCGWPWKKTAAKAATDLVIDQKALRGSYGDRHASAIIGVLSSQRSKKRRLPFDGAVDLGTAYYARMDWASARKAYSEAYDNASNDRERAAARYLECEALCATRLHSNYIQAGKLANEACRLVPDSKELAAARFKYWSLVQDEAQIAMSNDHVRSLDVRLEGTAVCDPLTVGVIVIAALGVLVTFQRPG